MPTLEEFKQGKRFGKDWNAATFQGMNEIYQSTVDTKEIVENLTKQPDNSEADKVGVAAVEIIGSGTDKKFKFKNLKGAVGGKGDPGGQGISFHGISQSISNIDAIVGAKIGDYFININKQATITILGIQTQNGDVIHSITAGTGEYTGSIQASSTTLISKVFQNGNGITVVLNQNKTGLTTANFKVYAIADGSSIPVTAISGSLDTYQLTVERSTGIGVWYEE